MILFVKLDPPPPPPMWLQPTTDDYDFDQFESTLSEVDFTNVTSFLRILLFRRRFLKFTDRQTDSQMMPDKSDQKS